MSKLTLKDSSTFCPVGPMPEGIKAGAKIKVDGQDFTVGTYVSPHQATIVEKSYHVLMAGCRKITPREVEFSVVK